VKPSSERERFRRKVANGALESREEDMPMWAGGRGRFRDICRQEVVLGKSGRSTEYSCASIEDGLGQSWVDGGRCICGKLLMFSQLLVDAHLIPNYLYDVGQERKAGV
jgi:hypothetical protein